MSPSRRAAWTLWTTTVLLVVTALLLPGNGNDAGTFAGASFALFVLQALTFATVGLVLARSRPRNSVSWLFGAVGLFVGLYMVTNRYQHYALVLRPETLPLGEVAAWLQTWLYVPALGIFVTLLPQLVPTGRPLSRRWNSAVVLAGVACLGLALSDATQPGRIDQSSISNPVGISPSAHVTLEGVASTLYLSAALVGFSSLIARWRRADVVERQQLKWFAYFAALLPLFVAVNGVIEVVGVAEEKAAVIALAMASAAFLGLPVGIAISILRYRLYDIDLVIKRTLVYAVLSLTLAAAYLGSVLLFRLLLSPVTGDSDLAVAGSTLAVAALFRPARSRIQALVDRRFYRARYDAGRTVEGFAARLRDELDLETLGTDLRTVVADTMQPAHVSLWLRDAR